MVFSDHEYGAGTMLLLYEEIYMSYLITQVIQRQLRPFFLPSGIQSKYMGVDIQRKKLKWNVRLSEQVAQEEPLSFYPSLP